MIPVRKHKAAAESGKPRASGDDPAVVPLQARLAL